MSSRLDFRRSLVSEQRLAEIEPKCRAYGTEYHIKPVEKLQLHTVVVFDVIRAIFI